MEFDGRGWEPASVGRYRGDLGAWAWVLTMMAGAVLAITLPVAVADGQQAYDPASPSYGYGPGPGSDSDRNGYSGDARAFTHLVEQTAEQSARSAARSSIAALMPDAKGKDGKYDWLRRTEIDWGFLQNGKPQQSILTVQPLYQSPDKRNTVFVQGSIYHYALFGEYRWTGNLGVGYRRLLAHNRVLLGVNGFYDDEITNNHRRASLGAEAKWGPLDWGINWYKALSGDRGVNGDIEKALGGWDTRLASQVPFLPWASVSARYYRWNAHYASNDSTGPEYAAELRLAPGLTLQVSHDTHDFSNSTSHGQNALMLEFRLAGRHHEPTLITGPVISKSIFAERDLSEHTLDKVRRENRILVERRTNINGATVIISRLN